MIDENKRIFFFPNTSESYDKNYDKIFKKPIKEKLSNWWEEFLLELFYKEDK